MPPSKDILARLAALKKNNKAVSSDLVAIMAEHSSHTPSRHVEKRTAKKSRRESLEEVTTTHELPPTYSWPQ